MFRIGNRLPPPRQKVNRPLLMASLGSNLPSASDSTRDSACDGLIAVAEALEKFRIRQPLGCPTLRCLLRPPRSSSAPGTPLRNQNVAALLGAAGFRSRAGFASPCSASLGLGGAVSTSEVGFTGRSFPLSRGGPGLHVGIGPGACCVAAGGGAAVWCVAGSRRDQTVGEVRLHGMRMREQFKCAYVRPDRGSLTSHQDRTASVMFKHVHRPPFTYDQPSLPSNVLPLRPVPVLKYWDFNGHNLAVSQQNRTFQKARNIRKV